MNIAVPIFENLAEDNLTLKTQIIVETIVPKGMVTKERIARDLAKIKAKHPDSISTTIKSKHQLEDVASIKKAYDSSYTYAIKAVVFVLLIIPVAISLIYLNIYFSLKSKKISKVKKDIIPKVKEFSFEEVKKYENGLTRVLKTYTSLYSQARPIKNVFLFKNYYKSVKQIINDLNDIVVELKGTYTYSAEELTKEQVDAATEYWSKVKTEKPQLYNIISKDKSGDRDVYNSKLSISKNVC